mgnify:CR=1 FL=1
MSSFLSGFLPAYERLFDGGRVDCMTVDHGRSKVQIDEIEVMFSNAADFFEEACSLPRPYADPAYCAKVLSKTMMMYPLTILPAQVSELWTNFDAQTASALSLSATSA